MSLIKNFSDNAGNSYACITLRGKADYAVWAYTMKEHLTTSGMLDIIRGTKTDDTLLAQRAKSVLLSVISPDEIAKIVHCNTAEEIWRHFAEAYGKNSSNEKLELMDELNNFRCNSAKEVSDTVGKVLTIRGKLKTLNVAIDDTTVLSAIKRALPDSYASFLENWKMLDSEQQTLNRFMSKVLEKSKDLMSKEENTAYLVSQPIRGRGGYRGQSSNFSSSSLPPQRYQSNQCSQIQGQSRHLTNQEGSVTCNYCKKVGHMKNDCRKLKFNNQKYGHNSNGGYHNNNQVSSGLNSAFQHQANQRSDSRYQINQRHNANYQNHHNSNNRFQNKQESNEIVFMAVDAFVTDETDSLHSNSTWIADSGCSAHMTPNKMWLRDYTVCTEPVNFKIGDSSYLSAEGSGYILSRSGKLDRVYHVPKLGANLFSVVAATSGNTTVIFDKDGLRFYNNGKVILSGTREQNTFILKLDIIQPTLHALSATTIDNWHKRLAHLPKDLILKMMNNNKVEGLRIISELPESCLDCKLNKCRRTAHRLSSGPKISKAGQSLHFDLVGPIQQPGLNNQKFILVCKDEASGFRLISCLKTKGETPETVKLMINQAEIQTGNSVLRITSDNGTEFTSDRLKIFTQHKGIEHRLSAPYVPQQNGYVERENQTLINQTRTLLNSAQMPDLLWPEAAATATYVNNRSISRTRDITPYENWFGKKPNLNNLHIFGEQASIFRQEHLRSKFDIKGTLMNFVSYTDNFQTFKFFDPISNKIVISCDVAFVNKLGPIQTTPQAATPTPTPISDSPSIDIRLNLPSPASATQSNLDCTPETAANTENVCTSLIMNDSTAETAEATETTEAVETIAEDHNDMNSSRLNTSDALSENQQHSFYQSTNDLSKDQSSELDRTLLNASSSETHTQPISRPVLTSSEQTNNLTRNLRSTERINYKNLSKGVWDLNAQVVLQDDAPTTVNSINGRNDAKLWREAMEKEMQSMITNQVFELTDRPCSNIVGCRWVFTKKLMADGSTRPKARLVAQGYTQRAGIDYFNTFAPVVHMDSVRLLLAVKASKRLCMKQFDICTAFLNGELTEEIFMNQPEGFSDGTSRVWRLKRSLYGLKQAPRAWNQRFTAELNSLGFKGLENEPCMFKRGKPLTYIGIYVDDALVLAESEEICNSTISQLQKEFDIHFVQTDKFLGFQYITHENGDISIHQTDYISKIVNRFGMSESNPTSTPIALGQAISDETPLSDNTLYREAVGALQYAATMTRLDIAFTVGYLGRKVINPTTTDFQILKRCLRYLKGTADLGITYKASSSEEISAYSDADFAGDKSTYKSTTGQLVLYGDSPISWKSRLQRSVVTSTTEAEFMACSSTIKTVLCIRNVAKELGTSIDEPTQLFCDNNGSVQIIAETTSAQRTRHLGAQLAFAREQHSKQSVNVQHIAGANNVADMLTKPLSTERFVNLRSLLMSVTLLSLLMLTAQGQINKRGFKEITFREIPMIVWEPTNIPLIIGRGEARIEINAFEKRCDKWNKFLNNNPDPQNTIHRMINYTRFQCMKAEHLVLHDLETLENHMKSKSSRRTRSVDVLSNNLDLEELRKQTSSLESTPDNGWGYLFSGVFPWVKDQIQYWNEDSNFNQVWKHSKILQQLVPLILSHNNNFETIKKLNNGTGEILTALTRGTNETKNSMEDLTASLPQIIEWMLIEYDQRTKLRQILNVLRTGFDRRMVYIEEVVKAFPSSRHLFHGAAPELTRFVEIEHLSNNNIRLVFEVPVIDQNTTIYNGYFFKKWINPSSYIEYHSENTQFMHNETSNCSRWMDSDHASFCTSPTRIFVTPNQPAEVTILNDTTKADSIIPTIVQLEDKILLQCFHNKILLNGKFFDCPMFPFELPITQNFIIKDFFQHSYKHFDQVNETEHEHELQLANLRVKNIWQDETTLILAKLEEMRTLNKQIIINPSTLDPFDKIKDTLYTFWVNNPTWCLFIITISSTFIITILYYCCKKDPLVKLMETSIMANLVNKQMQRSASVTSIPTAPASNFSINLSDESKRHQIEMNQHRIHRPPTPFVRTDSESSSLIEESFYPSLTSSISGHDQMENVEHLFRTNPNDSFSNLSAVSAPARLRTKHLRFQNPLNPESIPRRLRGHVRR